MLYQIVHQSPSGRQCFNVLGALNAITHELLTITNETYINAQSVCDLLWKITRLNLATPITFILDNVRYQRCTIVKTLAAQLQIELIFLPPLFATLILLSGFGSLSKDSLYSKYYSEFTKFKNAIMAYLLKTHSQHKQELASLLQYSYTGKNETHPLPLPLKDSLRLISEFFKHNTTNKLCLVFPSKEYAAQWLSVPLAFDLIKSDYLQYSDDIYNSYKKYKKGDMLILNNDAIVKWSRAESDFIYFKHKPNKNNEEEIGVPLKDIYILQPAPKSRRSLSSYDRVRKAISSSSSSPIDSLLEIKTYGNKLFQKKCLCLTSKFKSFDDSIATVLINHAGISDYFKYGKIDENGNIEEKCTLLISNNFSSLNHYLAQSNMVSYIIIDGFNTVTSRSDLSDIDRKFNIPTILITDLSEIETFEDINNFGFEFFNFTKENITIKDSGNQSPFEIFEKKLSNYVVFKFERDVCSNTELESISQILHSLPKDDSDENLNILKGMLIPLSNLLSRICHVPNEFEISNYTQKLNNIETHFSKCRLWLGDSNKPIQECISLLKSVIEKFSSTPSEKCARLKELMDANHYDFIICPTEDESKALNNFLNTFTYTHRPQVISVADVTDNLLSNKPIKAILTGWAKSNNINRILSSFLFSGVTVLFYQFENKYYNSLQRRNRKCNENIRATINSKGIRSEGELKKSKGFEHLYSGDEIGETTPESSFDIVEFELKLDNTQYSKYSAKGDISESCKAKRITFENSTFIYATESHKFIVVNELIDSAKQNPNIYSKKYESLQTGDVIAFINTDRDVLAELVQRNTKPDELAKIKKWTDLWKNLLREYYASIGNNFKRLVEDLKKYECKKHEVTIRNWLQDDNLIGPDSNDDLLSIAMLTNSELLYDNVLKVREAITQMTSLRLQAATIVRDKIKSKLMAIANTSIINTSIEIQGLGRVEILKICELRKESEEIDKRYVHRLIPKDFI